MPVEPWIANTDSAWFDFLMKQADPSGRVDEVNFWNPSGRPMRRLTPGVPVFLRLKSPRNAIAGYGFFAHFTVLRLDKAWELFGGKNGAPSLQGLLANIAQYRRESLFSLRERLPEIGCTILRDSIFWKPARWIPWGRDEGWAPNIVTGKTETVAAAARRLLDEILADHQEAPRELVQPFRLRDADDRSIVEARMVYREGQGTFRAVLLDAYGRRCAITGERTLPVLDAAHIQPYLGPGSNHVQNGLLLTKEFHTLFDLGYVTVTPAHEVRISRRLREDWKNGRRYYLYDGRALENKPDRPTELPSPEALSWHNERVFLS